MTESIPPSLVEVLLQQRESWRQGKARSVEQLLQSYPHLNHEEAILDLIYSEMLLRQQAGLHPTLQEYRERFPALEEPLRVLFEVEATLNAGLVASGDATVSASRLSLPRLQGCEILGELGRGAMGVVYRGWQSAMRRPVAVKLLFEEVPTGRIRSEIEAAARLHHPHIVALFEVKEYEGRVALILEYVEGGNLAQKLAGKPQPPRVAARLIELLSLAMAYAHDKGVIHRDLKPSNILLAGGSHAPLMDCTPKISDFGLARILRTESQGAEPLTRSTDLLGTPSYMAPEQAEGRRDLGPAVDVYSLGAILYECLTGRPPFLGETALATLEQVRFQQPVAPSIWQPGVPRDLEIICLKCLHKDPARRYRTAEALAEDLQRWQAGQVIRARPSGHAEHLYRWVLRQPLAAGLALLCSCACLALLYCTLTIYRLMWHQSQSARSYAAALDTQQTRNRELLYTGQLLRLGTVWQTHPQLALRLLEDAHLFPLDLRCFSWGVLRSQCRRYDEELPEVPAPISTLSYGTDSMLFVGTSDGRVFAKSPGSDRYRLIWTQQGAITSLVPHPSEEWLAVGGKAGKIDLLDSKTYQPLRVLEPSAAVVALAWHPDGRTLAVVAASPGSAGTVSLWDARSGRLRRALRGEVFELAGVALSPDGRTLASGCRDGTIRLWEVLTGKAVGTLRGHDAPVRTLLFTPQGQLVSAGLDSVVRLWAVDRQTEQMAVNVATGPVMALALHPEGKWLVVGGQGSLDRTTDEAVADIQMLELGMRTPSEPLRGHRRGVIALAYNADGSRFASADTDRSIKIWSHPPIRQSLRLTGHTGRPATTALSRQQRILAWISRAERPDSVGREIHVYDLEKDRLLSIIRGQGRTLQAIALSGDGSLVASVARHPDEVPELLVWEVASGRLLQAFSSGRDEVSGLCLTNRDLLTVSPAGRVRSWDLVSGRLSQEIQTPLYKVDLVAESPDGHWLALHGMTSQATSQIAIYQMQEKRLERVVTCPSRVRAVAVSNEGQAAWICDGYVQLEGREERMDLAVEEPTLLAFSPDARTLALGGTSAGVQLWDVPSLLERATLPGHTGGVGHLAFAGEGDLLVTVSRSGIARLWRRSR